MIISWILRIIIDKMQRLDKMRRPDKLHKMQTLDMLIEMAEEPTLTENKIPVAKLMT